MHEEDGMWLPKDWQSQIKVAENEVRYERRGG